MESDTDADADADETMGAQTTMQVARKADQITDAIKEKVALVTPEHRRRVKASFKIAFTVALTLLLVYWGIAYYFDVIWFEF